MFSPPHDLLDRRQLYIITSHLCPAADEGQFQSLIGHNCAVHTENLHRNSKKKKIVIEIYTFLSS